VHSKRVRAWVDHCDKLHQDFLPLHKVLLSPAFDDDRHSVLRQMSTSCLRTTGSVLVLLETDRHWDAELILRSVQEGTVKFAYLLTDRNQFVSRVREFSEDHFEIASLKTHDRASELTKILAKKKKKAPPALSAILLPQAKYDAVSSAYPRKVRQQIEGRWGFTRLIEALASSNSPVAELFPTLLHGYGMASHLQHADAVGVGVVAERESRPEPGRSRVKLAHIARIVSDCNAYSFMRLMSAYLFAEENTKPVYEAWEMHRKNFDDLIEAQREWEQVEFP
jgi:hypothetical protein